MADGLKGQYRTLVLLNAAGAQRAVADLMEAISPNAVWAKRGRANLLSAREARGTLDANARGII